MSSRPVIFLAFANDSSAPLPALAEELRQIRAALEGAADRGLDELGGPCELVIEPNATLQSVFDVLQSRRYRDRIAILHFSGHAGLDFLQFETSDGDGLTADARALGDVLVHQPALRLVVLNGCMTADQAEALVAERMQAVIASDLELADRVGSLFAGSFYRGLAEDLTVREAFQAAAAFVRGKEGHDWGIRLHLRLPELAEWRLSDLTQDPLWNLPPLPLLRLPKEPYRYLQWFHYEDAPIFFGRGREIRALYDLLTAPTAPQVLLLYGQSGVGKSSLLEAGLRPRLEQAAAVRYTRRSQAEGLTCTLADALQVPADGDLAAAWRAQETAGGRPYVVVIDQVEEVFTRPHPERPDELAQFIAAVQSVFAPGQDGPRGKLVLSFRKEFLAEIETRCADADLRPAKVFLERLDRRGILEAITGPATTPQLRRFYGLTVADGLPEEISGDMLADEGSSIAPVLQVLLAKAWVRAREANYDHPRFDATLYAALRREGLGLKDFLDQQLELLRAQDTVVDSGLALDVLAFYTTELGTAEERTQAELMARYAHIGADVITLVQQLQDLYLLVDPIRNQPFREPAAQLAHDTLAPIVRERMRSSTAPGQRARSILESKAVDWQGEAEGSTLDDPDLTLVEAGLIGMRLMTRAEQRLLDASRAARAQRVAEAAQLEAERQAALEAAARAAEQQRTAARLRRRAWWLALALGAALVSTIIAVWFYAQAAEEGRKTDLLNDMIRADSIAQNAVTMVEEAPQRALLLTLGALHVQERLGEPPSHAVEQSLFDLLAKVGGQPFWHADDEISAVDFSPDGRFLVAASRDGGMVLYQMDDTGLTGAGYKLAEGKSGGIIDVQFSPNGSRLAALMGSGRIQLWDVSAGVRPLPDSDYATSCTTFRSLAFSADGKRVVCVGDGATISRIGFSELHGGEVALYATRRGSEFSYSTALSRDQRWLAAAKVPVTQLWDLSDETAIKPALVMTKTAYSALGLAFSPDGRWLVGAGWEDRIQVARLDGAAGPREVPSLEFAGADISTLKFSPNGRWLISTGFDDSVLMWDAEKLGRTQAPAVLRAGRAPDFHADPPWQPTVNFSDDGKWFATTSGMRNNAYAWSIDENGGVGAMVVLAGHEDGLNDLDLSPDGHWAASAGRDGTARIWDLHRRAAASFPMVLPSGNAANSALAFSSDSSRLVMSRGENSAEIWQLNGLDHSPVSEILGDSPNTVLDAAFSPDRRWLAASGKDNSVALWDTKAGQGAEPIVLLPPQDTSLLGPGDGSTYSVATSPDGRWLTATTIQKNSTRLWDLQDSQPADSASILAGFAGDVGSVAFSPDSGRLAALVLPKQLRQRDYSISSVVDGRNFPMETWQVYETLPGSLHIWNLGQRYPFQDPVIVPFTQAGSEHIEFSPDGRWLVAMVGNDQASAAQPVLFDLTQAPPRETRLSDEQGGFSGTFRFSHSGHWLATTRDVEIEIWRVPPKGLPQKAFSLPAGRWPATQLAFSADERWLASAGRQQAVQLWDLASANPALNPIQLRGLGGRADALEISDDGRWLAVSAKGDVRVWPLALDDLAASACALAIRDLTEEERRLYFPGEPGFSVCASNGEPEVLGPTGGTVLPTLTPLPTATFPPYSPLPTPESPLAVPLWFQ